VRVGLATGGGISGGQKRKLALGVEMLTMPALLLLDEPTSGLDATSSFDVMEAVRGWCDTGRSAIVTIHQPRKEIFAAFDKLLLLYGGDLALLCSPNQALKCMLSMADLIHWDVGDITNPADVMLDFLTHDAPAEMQSRTDGSAYQKLGELLVDLRKRMRGEYDIQLRGALSSLRTSSPATPGSSGLGMRRGRSFYQHAYPSEAQAAESRGYFGQLWTILWVLESRFLKEHSFLALNIPSIQTSIFALVFSLLYFRIAMMYSLAACLLMISVQPAATFFLPLNEATFAPPGACYHFEIASGVYRPVERFLQLHLHFSAASFGTTIAFILATYLMAFNPAVELTRGAYMVFVCLVDVQTQLAKVFLIVALSMNLPGATLGKISQIINAMSEVDKTFAGLFFQPDKVLVGVRFLFVLTPTFQTFPALCRIAFEGFAIPESTCAGDLSCLSSRSGDAFLSAFGFDEVDVATNALLLVVRWLVYVSLAATLYNKAAWGWTWKAMLRSLVAGVPAVATELSPEESQPAPVRRRFSMRRRRFAAGPAAAGDAAADDAKTSHIPGQATLRPRVTTIVDSRKHLLDASSGSLANAPVREVDVFEELAAVPVRDTIADIDNDSMIGQLRPRGHRCEGCSGLHSEAGMMSPPPRAAESSRKNPLSSAPSAILKGGRNLQRRLMQRWGSSLARQDSMEMTMVEIDQRLSVFDDMRNTSGRTSASTETV